MADEPHGQVALVPVRQETVNFYGDELPAGQLADGTILVPLRPIVEALGLTWPAQRLRLNRDPVLAGAQGVIVMNTPGGPQEMLALPLKILPGFLFGLNATRVKPELRDKILRYQADCYEVLWNAFKADILPQPTAPPADLSPAEQALILAEAVASLARQHLELEQKQSAMADYLRPFVQQTRHELIQQRARLDQHAERLSALELHLSGGATISEAQASEIQLAVKNVAMLLTGRGDANGFGRVWGEFYRRFRVGAYRNLPAARYDEALGWLRGWFDELSTDTR